MVLKHHRKKTADGGGGGGGFHEFGDDGRSLLGFSSISEIDVRAYDSNERNNLTLSSSFLKPMHQLNISEIPSSTKSSNKPSISNALKQITQNRRDVNYPSMVAEESTMIMKTDRIKEGVSMHSDKLKKENFREKFFEDAFLIGLAHLMKTYNPK